MRNERKTFRRTRGRKTKNIFYLKNSNNTLNISRDTRKIYFCCTNRRCHPPDCQTMSRVYWVNLIYMFRSDDALNGFSHVAKATKIREIRNYWRDKCVWEREISRKRGMKWKKIERERDWMRKFIKHSNLCKSKIISFHKKQIKRENKFRFKGLIEMFDFQFTLLRTKQKVRRKIGAKKRLTNFSRNRRQIGKQTLLYSIYLRRSFTHHVTLGFVSRLFD